MISFFETENSCFLSIYDIFSDQERVTFVGQNMEEWTEQANKQANKQRSKQINKQAKNKQTNIRTKQRVPNMVNSSLSSLKRFNFK